jgi:NAD/NADP transhydrogenase beta subunit
MSRRRVVSIIDQIPGALFVAGAIVVLGLLQGARLVAQLRRNPGAVELAGILFTAGFVVLVIFAVRRRQTDVWVMATQVLAAIIGSNLLGMTLVWPFLPSELPVSLTSSAWNGLANGLTGAFVGLPLGAAGLWLSRRWGTESGLTERRARRVPEQVRQPEVDSSRGTTNLDDSGLDVAGLDREPSDS